MVTLVVAVLVVLVGSALCSGSEAALFSVSEVRARQRAEAGGRGARALLRIKERMSRPIATIVILNNVFNIVGSITVGAAAVRELGSQWVGVVSGVLTFLVIIAAEIIPKTLGERFAEPVALAVARPVLLLTRLLHPIVRLVEIIVSPITGSGPRLTTDEAEIQLLARIGHEQGVIQSDEARLVQRAFRLNDTTARMVMTPRVSLTWLKGERTVEESAPDVLDSPHTRLVVVGDSVDDVLGVVRRGTLLGALARGQGSRRVRDLAKPVRFVPQTARADALLRSFQSSRQHLAVVVDEFGGVAGVVTLEDVLEILTGEIVDETDRVADLQALARQRRRAGSDPADPPG